MQQTHAEKKKQLTLENLFTFMLCSQYKYIKASKNFCLIWQKWIRESQVFNTFTSHLALRQAGSSIEWCKIKIHGQLWCEHGLHYLRRFNPVNSSVAASVNRQIFCKNVKRAYLSPLRCHQTLHFTCPCKVSRQIYSHLCSGSPSVIK